MTETNDQKTPKEKLETSDEIKSPTISVRSQYVKDLSFENPRAPESLFKKSNQPKIEINVDVKASPLKEKPLFEIALTISVKAVQNEEVSFIVELIYAGLFSLENIPEDQLKGVCLVECPRILFPFARKIIADSTSEGGFPPLLLDPIDFHKLYIKQRESVDSN